MERQVAEDRTIKEDTSRGQRAREELEEGKQLSWSKSSGLCLLSCRQPVAESEGRFYVRGPSVM